MFNHVIGYITLLLHIHSDFLLDARHRDYYTVERLHFVTVEKTLSLVLGAVRSLVDKCDPFGTCL